MTTADKEKLLMTFVFETMMAQITQTRAFTRIGPHADRIAETWDNTVSDMEDMTETAHRVHTRLKDGFQMVDMSLDSEPTVALLLERDLLNAASAQVYNLLAAKASALLGCYHEHEALEELAGRVMHDATEWTLALWLIAGADYYREPLVGLARKMDISLLEEDQT